MPARTCTHCRSLTPSPWQPVCDRPDCRARERETLDAIIDASIATLRQTLRAEIEAQERVAR